MSIKSQEGHMRQLALLLTADLDCIFGERESGPNGSKKAFLNVGKVFLRALAKDLGLHEVTVSANSGGIAVSGTCSLYGMWEDRGIAVWIEQRLCADGKVFCYRTIRSSRDFKGGYNHFLTSSDLKTWSYPTEKHWEILSAGGNIMAQLNPKEMQQALALPFAPEDLEWRLQNTIEEKMRGLAVPYVTNRAIQNRLDEVCGPENWYNDFKPWHSNGKKEAQLCGIAIYFEGRGFITKWDGAEDSDIEAVKGGLSDSMKRAAVQWGIGRVLYDLMLAHLTLLPKHSENLLERGLSEERIRRNEYRSMPETERGRRLLADLLRSHGHDLHGIPGFRTYYGDWTLSGPNGFLIPVRNKDGLIQGLKIRLDDAQQANRKYRWLSSRNLPSGTRSYSWVHVTGNTQSKRAFLTEGPLKGDVASFLAQDALFICIGGVNALNGLNDTIRSLGVREVVEAMDMDQMTNPNVRSAILTMRKEVRKIPGIRYSKYTWNPAYKGVDDYLLSQAATM